ncbi:odorant receptor 4-like [Odontomachus brunneus]|uniref:odorant receptor 4-like n=1 Tax=Odontomachus brunneus TaxID=486640 RepID=UPI0013F254FF|nr:odorant receptor 4-like [Odontomachus brunneus]
MQLLPLNFLIFTVSGIWRSVEWLSRCTKLLYNTFTFYTIAPLYFWVFSQFINLVLIIDNMEEFIVSFFIFLSYFAVSCKAAIAIIRRGAIIDLVETLSRAPCKPRDADEVAIQTKFDELIRSGTKQYALLAMGSVSTFNIQSVLNIMDCILPCQTWTLYDLNSYYLFLITGIQEIVLTMCFSTVINVGMATLIFGMVLQTCAQLEIFEKRVHKLIINRTTKLVGKKSSPDTSTIHKEEMISGYICHHFIIYKYAKTLNNAFNQVLFVQFFVNTYILCTVVYYLASHIMDSHSIFLMLYTICMFIQIYIYCWAGNKVILKSASLGNAVYQINWYMLSNSEKKNLLMIMKRSTIPIKFISSFLIILSLDAFIGVSIIMICELSNSNSIYERSLTLYFFYRFSKHILRSICCNRKLETVENNVKMYLIIIMITL